MRMKKFINMRNCLGLTALDIAAACGHEEMVAALIDIGATVDRPMGPTPLHYAAVNGHAVIAEILLTATPNQRDLLRRQDFNWATALEVAKAHHHPEVITLLESYAPTPSLKRSSGTIKSPHHPKEVRWGSIDTQTYHPTPIINFE